MLDLFFTAFCLAFLGRAQAAVPVRAGLCLYRHRRAAKVSWGFLTHIPISLIAFSCALLGWIVAEDKNGIRISRASSCC
jgi:hypothetical protein